MTLYSCDSYTSSVFSWYGSLSLQKVPDANHYGDLPQRITSESKKSSVFYSLRRLDIWVSCSALDLSTAPSIPPTFLTICNRKTITQSAEIPIFVGETRRSHICSQHGSSLGHAPGQADSISRAETMVRWSLCGRPPREAERWHHWENENSSAENSYLRNDLPEFESSKRILFPTPFQRQSVFSVNPIILEFCFLNERFPIQAERISTPAL